MELGHLLTRSGLMYPESLFKGIERYTKKIFDRFTKKDSYTWNITHNKESTAV
jgi:hypothetical protein